MDTSSNKNRILMISYDLPPTGRWGQAKHVQQLTQALSKRYIVDLCSRNANHSNSWVTLTSTPTADAAFIESSMLPNESYVDFERLQAWNTIFARQINQFYRSTTTKPTIVHNHNWMTFPAAQIIAKQLNIPLVSSIHFVERQYTLTAAAAPTQPDLADIITLEKSMAKSSDRIIAFGENHKQFFVTEYACAPEKIDVIPHGVDLTAYKERVNNTHTAVPTIAFVGRLVEEKGIREFLRAIETLQKQNLPVRGVVVGEGSLRAELERRYATRDVRFTGWVPPEDVRSILHNADIFCSPTYTESFGLSTLEAMASGLPIVMTHGPTIEPLLTASEGLLVDTKREAASIRINERMLTENLAQLVRSEPDRRFYGMQSREAARRYGESAMVEKTCVVYEKLQQNNKPTLSFEKCVRDTPS